MLRKLSDISALTEMQKHSRITGNRENQVKKRYNINFADDTPVVREKLKQEIPGGYSLIRA